MADPDQVTRTAALSMTARLARLREIKARREAMTSDQGWLVDDEDSFEVWSAAGCRVCVVDDASKFPCYTRKLA